MDVVIKVFSFHLMEFKFEFDSGIGSATGFYQRNYRITQLFHVIM